MRFPIPAFRRQQGVNQRVTQPETKFVVRPAVIPHKNHVQRRPGIGFKQCDGLADGKPLSQGDAGKKLFRQRAEIDGPFLQDTAQPGGTANRFRQQRAAAPGRVRYVDARKKVRGDPQFPARIALGAHRLEDSREIAFHVALHQGFKQTGLVAKIRKDGLHGNPRRARYGVKRNTGEALSFENIAGGVQNAQARLTRLLGPQRRIITAGRFFFAATAWRCPAWRSPCDS